jgi:hypothetical protein
MLNKRGVSVIVGYVLLITFGLILSVIVYNYLKTYVPADSVSCPEGVSLLLKSYSYSQSSGQLNLTFENNGKFDLNGYTLHATTNPNQTIATYDLSKYFNSSSKVSQDGRIANNYIFFFKTFSALTLGKETYQSFNLPPSTKICSLQIVPIKLQVQDGSQTYALCGNSQVTQPVSC